jgi:hypothetical protein
VKSELGFLNSEKNHAKKCLHFLFLMKNRVFELLEFGASSSIHGCPQHEEDEDSSSPKPG